MFFISIINNIRRIFLLTILFILFAILFSPVTAQENETGYDDSYTVETFNSDISFTAKGVDVIETIKVDFKKPKRGIFRHISNYYEYNANEFSKKSSSRLIVDIKNVTDETGKPLITNEAVERASIFNPQNFFDGLFFDVLILRIGDENRYLIGEHTYVISYSITNFPAGSKFFTYPLIQTGWSTDINNYSATIKYETLPDTIECKVGLKDQDKDAKLCDSILQISSNEYKITQKLVPFKGGLQLNMTGINFEHNTSDVSLFMMRYWFLLIVLLVIIGLIIYWLMSSKKPKGTGIITPQFSIPEQMSPAQVGTIYDDSVDKIDLSATILDLAVRGYIIIENTGKNSKDIKYFLNRTNKTDNLQNFEMQLLNKIFNNKNRVELSKLSKTRMYQAYTNMQNMLYLWGIKNGYFKTEPQKKNAIIFALVTAFVVSMPAFLFNFLSWIISILCGIIIFVISWIVFYMRNYKTRNGVLIKEKITGLKLFIEYAKKDQLEVLYNSKNISPQKVFEKYLPYAMIFGLNTVWFKAFENIPLTPPEWYTGTTTTDFWTAFFTYNYLSSFSSTINDTFTISPSQSGAGFSGGSIGGAIGGGFSGGGGSW